MQVTKNSVKTNPTHLAMLDVDAQGNTATWGDHVSDVEYSAAPPMREG
jgi:hypothetical protein